MLQELGASFESSDKIPAGMEDDVAKYREALLEAAVEQDDDAMEAYLEVCIKHYSKHAKFLNCMQ